MMFPSRFSSQNNQKGVVLIVLALLAVVLILFIGLAIDTAILSSSHLKQGRTAELVALGAMEKYLLEASETDYTARMEKVLVRAEEIAGFDMNVISTDHTKQADTVTGTPELTDPNFAVGTGTAGTLEGGQYFFVEPAQGCAEYLNPSGSPAPPSGPNRDDCPCPSSGDFKECFRPFLDSETLAEQAKRLSAFRVRLKTRATNPIRTFFAKIVGQDKVSLNSEAMSSVLPRHAVFLVDLSNSITFETHVPVTDFIPANNHRFSRFSFARTTAAQCTTTDQVTDGCAAGLSYSTGNNYNPPPPALPPSPITPFFTPLADYWVWWERTGYQGLEDCRPVLGVGSPSPGLRARNKRYKSDYECYTAVLGNTWSTMTQTWSATALTDEHYFIESPNVYGDARDLPREVCSDGTIPCGVSAGATDRYFGPEPLTAILMGVYQALLVMDKYSIPGDALYLVAHDDGILQPRSIGPIYPGSAEFINLKRLTNVEQINLAPDYPDAHRVTGAAAFNTWFNERVNTHLLFPRTPGFTDLPESLHYAHFLLNGLPNASMADSWVAVFSDGLSNCAHFRGPTNTDPLATDADIMSLIEANKASIDFLVADSSSPPKIYFADGGHASGEMDCGQDAWNDDDPIVPTNAQFAANGLNANDRNAWVERVMHIKSIYEISSIISGTKGPLEVPSEYEKRSFMDEEIKVHSFLFGDYVQPHTLVKISAHEGCMTDGEARAANPKEDFTVGTGGGGTYGNFSAASPYLGPNETFYKNVSEPTGGYFVPVRPSCEGIVSTCTGLETALHAACDAAKAGVPPANAGDILDESLDGAGTDVDNIVIDGRLICDPTCRDGGQQIREQVQLLFQDNPFVLVEPPQ